MTSTGSEDQSSGLGGEEPCWSGAAVGETLNNSGAAGIDFSRRSDIAKENSFRKKIMQECFNWTRSPSAHLAKKRNCHCMPRPCKATA